MAGRNLFADDQTNVVQKPVGRNLFAVEPQPTQPQPAQSPQQNSGFIPDSVGGETRGISSGSPFKDGGVTFPGFVEPAATIASSVVAEPVAGLVGAVGSFNTPQDPNDPYVLNPSYTPSEAGSKAVSSTREALTYQPKTEVGQEVISDIGEVLSPVGEFVRGMEEGLGDTVFESTGSPALAAAATTIPTFVAELVGVASGRGMLKATTKMKKGLADGRIMREIDDAVPSIEKLKDTSRQVYKEIDEMGVSVDINSYDELVDSMSAMAEKAGLDKTITPEALAALNRFDELKGTDVTLTKLNTLREVAGGAASSIKPKEAMLGSRMIEMVDDFLEASDASTLRIPQHIDTKNVGKRYKIARDMWGRARKSELLEESFEKARNQASGFENGIRTQFRAILNNKKKSKFFSKDELSAIKKVVRGDAKQNIARLIGKLGFSEGSATQLIGGSLGVGAGAYVGGPVGAVFVPLVGQISKKLAQRMTVKGAEFADQVIRAGSNAKKITKAYLKNTPKLERSAQELSELLTRNDIDLGNLPGEEFVNEAKRLAIQRRVDLATAVSAGGAKQQLNNKEQ